MYDITDYTNNQARRIGTIVKPSQFKDKKIDIYDANTKQYITSVGKRGMSDYPTYIQTHGKAYADKRRQLFYKRFKDQIDKVGSNAWYSAMLLW